MVVEFYCNCISPPCNTAHMVVVALGVQHEVKTLNLFEAEHKQPQYLEINPAGKVPAIRDGDFCLAESRAISTYLCDAYGKNSQTSLYPSDLKERAKVNQILHASMKTDDDVNAYINFHGVFFGEATGVNEAKLADVHQQLKICEHFLNQSDYIAADHLTIADFFMASPFHLLHKGGFNVFDKYPKTAAWLKRIRELPYFDLCNKEGLEFLFDRYKTKLAANCSAAQ